MPLLYFNPLSANTTNISNRHDDLLDRVVPCGVKVEVFTDAETLVKRLHRSLHDITGIVLIIAGKSDLHTFKRHEELLEEIPLFVLLPVDDPEMVTLGHSLYPRYLATVNDNLEDFHNVLWQYIRTLKQKLHHLGYDMCGVTW